MKAVFLDFSTMGAGLDVSPLTNQLPGLETFDITPTDEVAGRIRDAEYVFVNKVRLTGALLAQAPKLRLIGLTATGTDNVDLEFAADNGIAVCNIRKYCTRSVAEHVFGLLLALTRSLRLYTADVRAGAWQQAQDFCMLTHPIRELAAMTLGIVGYGDLGRAVAALARAFEMNVIVSARPGSKTVPDDRVPFEELLEQSDVISLHCPLTDATRHLFDTQQFAAMKPTAVLINTARGGLIEPRALVDALSSGQIAAAVIDVLAEEPPVAGNPLLDYRGDNLLVTPHIAWASDRARQNAIDELAANVQSFIDGGNRNRVV